MNPKSDETNKSILIVTNTKNTNRNMLKTHVHDHDIKRKILNVYEKNQSDNTVSKVVALHRFLAETGQYNLKSKKQDYSYDAIQEIYRYANRIKKQIIKTIRNIDQYGSNTVTVPLPECFNEPRRIQDLICFIGIWNHEYEDYILVGSGTTLGLRRKEILDCLIERIIHILKPFLNVESVEAIPIMNKGDITYRIDLPYKLSEQEKSFTDFTVGYLLSIKYSMQESSLTPVSSIKDIDKMDGPVFENFCAELLRELGYQDVRVTKASGDQGIDIIAFKDSVKYGIQCKRYSENIGNNAIQEANAGKAYYGCHVGIVMTNEFFTSSAKQLANAIGIVLWDRDKLTQMISARNKQLKLTLIRETQIVNEY